MLFSDRPRTHYEKTLAHEVICQLRFPTILSINNVEPADFQERIREDFPQYARKQDVLPPQIVNGKPEPQPPVTNYHFLSQDGRWKLNLTKDFIALSTLSYPGWEDRVVNCACDTQFKLDSSCTAKIHAGIGRLKTNIPNAPQDPEVKFIFDMDLSMGGNTACGLAAAALETLHGHSSRVFEGAITDRLRDAMGR